MKFRLLLVILILGGLHSAFAQSAPAYSELENLILEIQPAYLEQEGDFMVYSPDSDVMKAKYVRYYFVKENFLAVIGSLEGLATPIKITAVLVRLGDRTRIPGDPRLPSPQGGFTDIRYLAVLRGLVK